MFYTLLLSALTLCYAVNMPSTDSEGHMMVAFEEFIEEFGIVYENEAHRMERWGIFRRNLMKIADLEKEHPLATFGVTKFMDLTTHEFSKLHSGCFNHFAREQEMRDELERQGISEENKEYSFSGSKDWVAEGAVTDVKNQGNCGSCWSFSTTGALEGAHYIATGELLNLSEQQLVDCSVLNSGCDGGSMALAFFYTERHPLETETDYPYTSGDSSKAGSCSYNSAKGKVAASTYTNVDSGSVSALKNALDVGPVSVAIQADQPVFQFYTGGIISGSSCGTALDHGVLAVGYADGYFKVKNSWSADWGESGYVRIADSSDNVCGILTQPVYPSV